MLKFLRRGEREDRERTRSAVRRTGQRWFRRMTGVFQRSEIDEEMWEELEEILISADVGVSTTMKLLDDLRDQVLENGVTAPEQAFELLKDAMVEALTVAGCRQGHGGR